MNLILLHPSDFTDTPDIVRLTGRRLRHVLQIHKAAVGDTLCVGLINGRTGRGLVRHLDPQSLEMEVRLEQEPPPKIPLTLILALPRPKVLKRALISATSMGVDRIILIHSWRVEKSYWQSPTLTPETLRETLILGLEQAKDTVLPHVEWHRRFKPFVEDVLPGISKDSLCLIAHPAGSTPCPRHVTQPTTLVIGPEGGFIPFEVDHIKEQGFTPVHFGERILRVETVIPALIGRLF